MSNIIDVSTAGFKCVGDAWVFGKDNAVRGSKYPKVTETSKATAEITDTTEKLATCRTGTGHDNFLNGVLIQFDLNLSLKAWVEAERYHFLDFISSMSTMHRIAQMDIRRCCNEYVTDKAIENAEELLATYKETGDPEDYLRLLYNVPTGFVLTAKMTTNYRQLKTIYQQRLTHRLPEWKEFCAWIETLPNASWITGKQV